MNRTHRIACAAALSLAATGLCSCGGSGAAAAESASAPPPATAVSVARVTRHDLARELELSAEFRPYQEIDLHAKVSGYLKTILVDVGDQVKQGQLLAVLEVPEMNQDLAQAASNVKRNSLEVERAKGEVQRAESNLNIRKLSFDRLAGVAQARPHLIAQQEIDDAEARLRDAEAQVAAARANMAATEEQVTASTVGRDRIDTMLSYLRITAPFSGVITQRRGDPGALVQAGTASQTQAMPVVRLSQVDRLRLVLPVPESVVPRIRIGSPVEVRVEALNRVFQGRVARFTERLDSATRTMETEVDLSNPGLAIKPGMFGNASLRLDRRENALAVPVQAIAEKAGAATVMVVNAKNQLEQRTVETGLETPDLIEVKSNLREGDLVVIGNRSSLKAGTLVTAKPIEPISSSQTH
jgi:RND family efflux transporter MFP subunit